MRAPSLCSCGPLAREHAYDAARGKTGPEATACVWNSLSRVSVEH